MEKKILVVLAIVAIGLFIYDKNKDSNNKKENLLKTEEKVVNNTTTSIPEKVENENKSVEEVKNT